MEFPQWAAFLGELNPQYQSEMGKQTAVIATTPKQTRYRNTIKKPVKIKYHTTNNHRKEIGKNNVK
jgi:hypothetical protein